MNNFEPGSTKKSIAKVFGHKLKEQAEQNPSFYLFSPDETTSNKLDEIYQATTRAWGVSTTFRKCPLLSDDRPSLVKRTCHDDQL